MRLKTLSLSIAALLTACVDSSDTITVGPEDITKAGDGKFDSSVEAVIVDFELDGELVSDSAFSATQQINDQLLFTMGQLNGDNGVARLDRVVLSNVKTTTVGGRTRITYHAKVPVAWGKRNSVPATYELALPRDMAFAAKEAFFAKYEHECVEPGAHELESGNFWYYYRPAECTLAAADVVRVSATVSLSALNTTGKFPEYTKVWEDGVLNVVAVFGKYEDTGMDGSDAGIAAYNAFVRDAQNELRQFAMTTVPATIPTAPGVGAPDVTIDATLPDGRKVHVTAMLTNQIRNTNAAFDTRYAQVTPNADFLSYNGHSGLGANIRALTRKGSWRAGQYTLAFINGCDTYAYVDSSLALARAELNPGDPTGSKHLDIATNAMPSFFHSNSRNNIQFIRSLMNIAQPMSYEQIFKLIDRSQVIVVSGEEDNVFVPGGGGGGGNGDANWAGLTQQGSVSRNQELKFSTPKLAPGSYKFTMTGSSDADLYVRIGSEPTAELFDCRPFLSGSNETCTVSLNTAAPLHVMVRGWNPTSSFKLVGAKQ
ncbi:MAG: PPC domain-containing protein [Deltaproteobacteria bacterium]|nr:PPC domain-containing protein [Deltaproteobacteria bacterium]